MTKKLEVFLDFETYYDDEYSLKKMSIEEYVRDSRFDALLLCIAIGNGGIVAFRQPVIAKALLKLKPVLEDARTVVMSHNYKFDGFILSNIYDIHPKNVMCTRCAARYTGVSRLSRESLESVASFLGCGEKGKFLLQSKGRSYDDFSVAEMNEFIDYCRMDVLLLRNIWNILECDIPDDAREFISLSLKMYTEPVFVLDKARLSEYYGKLRDSFEKSRERLAHLFAFPSVDAFLKALRSADKFCAMLRQLGGEAPMKLSEKKTETARKKLEAQLPDPSAQIKLEQGDYQVYVPALAKNDIPFMELQHSPNPDIALLATARAENNSSIAMSRCKTFMDIAERGTLPVSLEAYFAHTGRYSAGTTEGVRSDATNLQNLAKRGGDKTLRTCVRAPSGYKLVACDSSQIEARVLAWAAGEQWLLKAFAEGSDPYCHMASNIYGEPYAVIHDWTKGAHAHSADADASLKAKYKSYRNIGKTAVLQLGYYAGAKRFGLYLKQQGIRLADTDADHDAEATRIVSVYRQSNPNIKRFWGICDEVLSLMVAGQRGQFGPAESPFLFSGAHLVDRKGHTPHAVASVRLPDGYHLCYPNLRIESGDGRPEIRYDLIEKGKLTTKRLHAGILCNNICQGTAFALIRYQACLINKRYPIRINIHDSLGIVVPQGEVDEAVAYIEHCMLSVPDWAKGIPIGCESAVGDDFLVA